MWFDQKTGRQIKKDIIKSFYFIAYKNTEKVPKVLGGAQDAYSNFKKKIQTRTNRTNS